MQPQPSERPSRESFQLHTRRIVELSAQIEELDRVIGTWPAHDTVFLDALRARRDRLQAELADSQQQLRALITIESASRPSEQAGSAAESRAPEPPTAPAAGTASAFASPAPREVAPEPPASSTAAPRQSEASVAPTIVPQPRAASASPSGWAIGVILALSVAALVLSCVALVLIWSILAGFLAPRSGASAPAVPPAAAAPGLGRTPTVTTPPTTGPTRAIATATPATSTSPTAIEPVAALEAPRTLAGGGDAVEPADGRDGDGDGGVANAAAPAEVTPQLATGTVHPPPGYLAASLHTLPSTAAPMLTMVPRGATVQLLGEWASGSGYTWARVRTPGGLVGWMIASAILSE